MKSINVLHKKMYNITKKMLYEKEKWINTNILENIKEVQKLENEIEELMTELALGFHWMEAIKKMEPQSIIRTLIEDRLINSGMLLGRQLFYIIAYGNEKTKEKIFKYIQKNKHIDFFEFQRNLKIKFNF